MLPSNWRRSRERSVLKVSAMRVAVCGGVIIGACLAYHLSREGAQVLLFERHEIAGAASGKPGGFLALEWCDGSALAPLGRRSFQLHAELADAHGNPWGSHEVFPVKRR